MFCNITGFSRGLRQYPLFLSVLTVLFLGFFYLFNCCLEQEASADEEDSLRSTHFRIGMNTPLSAMQWYEDVDVNTAGIHRNTSFRVRFQIYNDTAETEDWLPVLEYLETGGSWTTVQSIPGAQPFFVTITGQFVNEEAIAVENFVLGSGSGTPQEGRAYCASPLTLFSLEAFSYTEVEFNIQANTYAGFYTPYSFRITNNGTAFDVYDVYAVVSVWEDDNILSPHYGYNSTTAKCASCHRVHTGTGDTLRIAWPEENLCNTCHDGTGSRTDIAYQFTEKNWQHPISANEGIHTSLEGYYNWLPAGSRHVECEDCHNPHGSRTGASTPGFGDLSRTIENTWGVFVINPAAQWTGLTLTNYARVSAVTAEYQLCFKCHSSFAYDTAPPLSHTGGIVETDQALEFNVNNASYHWVETDKTASSGPTPRTNSASRDMSFTPGSAMTKTTPMNCSDCHAGDTDTEPEGPHGSDREYLLRGTWSDTPNGTSYTLCLECHDPDVYGPGGSYTADKTNFSGFYRRFANTDPAPNLHVYHWNMEGVDGCQNCHSAVPHGGWNRALLVEMDDPAPYSNGSKLTINSWDPGGGWLWLDCHFSPCH